MTATLLGADVEQLAILVGAVIAGAPVEGVVVADSTDSAAVTTVESLGADATAFAGTVILNADDGTLAPLLGPLRATIVTVGLSSGVDFQATDVELSTAGTVFTLHHGAAAFPVVLHLLGEQSVIPALLAIAAGVSAGVPVVDAIERLRGLEAGARWRMQALRPSSGILVINDAARATYATTAEALKSLALLTLDSGRSVAVLGALDSEPGEALDDHDRIGRLIVRLNIKKLIVVGYEARHIQVAAGLEGSWDGESVLVDSAEEAYDLVTRDAREGDVVLVKSSWTAGLRTLGDRLGGVTE